MTSFAAFVEYVTRRFGGLPKDALIVVEPAPAVAEHDRIVIRIRAKVYGKLVGSDFFLLERQFDGSTPEGLINGVIECVSLSARVEREQREELAHVE